MRMFKAHEFQSLQKRDAIKRPELRMYLPKLKFLTKTLQFIQYFERENRQR